MVALVPLICSVDSCPCCEANDGIPTAPKNRPEHGPCDRRIQGSEASLETNSLTQAIRRRLGFLLRIRRNADIRQKLWGEAKDRRERPTMDYLQLLSEVQQEVGSILKSCARCCARRDFQGRAMATEGTPHLSRSLRPEKDDSRRLGSNRHDSHIRPRRTTPNANLSRFVLLA